MAAGKPPDAPPNRRKSLSFLSRREALLRSLSSTRRDRYARLVQVCRDIETAGADNLLASADPATDPRLRKLDELMWTLPAAAEHRRIAPAIPGRPSAVKTCPNW